MWIQQQEATAATCGHVVFYRLAEGGLRSFSAIDDPLVFNFIPGIKEEDEEEERE